MLVLHDLKMKNKYDKKIKKYPYAVAELSKRILQRSPSINLLTCPSKTAPDRLGYSSKPIGGGFNVQNLFYSRFNYFDTR